MSSIANTKAFPLRKVRSTYSLPEGKYQIQNNGCINQIKNLSSASNHSLCLKSYESSKSCKGSSTFIAKYKNNCKTMNCQPLSLVKVQFSDVFLDLIVDRIRYIDWLAILRTIRKDKTLHFISLRSKIKGYVVQEHIDTDKKAQQTNKESVFYTRYLINKLCESLGESLTYSRSLLCLQLCRIPLMGPGIEILGEGLKRTQSLQHLSLQYCNVEDAGCLILSQALRNIPTLITLDLSFCKITALGAKYISNLIKFQEIARLGECWKQSLRYREVDNDQIQGLRRITLNDNPDIGDVGLQSIIEVLMDDFWVRALDMQNCGITEDGANLVMRLIEINNEIGVVDLRRNPLLSTSSVARIIQILSSKIKEEKEEYVWLHLVNDYADNLRPPGSAINVTNCNSHIWNRGSRNGKNTCSNLSIISTNSETAKISINKVKTWKQSSQNIQLKENELKNKNAAKKNEDDRLLSENCITSNTTVLDRITDIENEETLTSDTASVIRDNGNFIDEDQNHEPEKVGEITRDIKDIFLDFIKHAADKKRDVKLQRFSNVNYDPRDYESDSD